MPLNVLAEVVPPGFLISVWYMNIVPALEWEKNLFVAVLLEMMP